MTSAAKRLIVIAAALFAGAVLMQEGLAQAPPPGVFAEVQTAVVSRQTSALEPATMRSRVVRLDAQRVTAARRGREVLKLNLFDDAVVDVAIKRVRPTRTGYFISGTPKGKEWGEVRLVVNGPVMVGTVETPEGTFSIRFAGAGRHLVRQIDPSKDTFECEVEAATVPGLTPQPSDLPAISSIDPVPADALSPPAQAEDMPTEDGSIVRVLVAYTKAARDREGGAAGMRALIDLMIQSTNRAFEEGGISPRLELAHTTMVDYAGRNTSADLARLRDPSDGHMDEVHALRNEHAADLVHLLTTAAVGAGGTTASLVSEDLSAERSAAFSVTANRNEGTFAHETGHSFGLRHDRYVTSPNSALYPYAFGYSNKAAFEPNAPLDAQWRTIMAYPNRCNDAGFPCRRLFRFSNPDQQYEGDPLGVPADSAATGADGPADARLTINKSAPWVGSFRSQACTDFSISPELPIAGVEGGEVVLMVETAPGCLWEVASESAFLAPTAEGRSAGAGFVRIDVEANETGEKRTGTISVAGKTVTVSQLAIHKGVCDRTPAVISAITKAAGFADSGHCERVSDPMLDQIGALFMYQEGLTSLKAGDFEGLSNLTLLNLELNELAELPKGVFAGLSRLEALTLSRNRLVGLPDGLFAGLTNLRSLNLQNNSIRDLPVGVLAGLTKLDKLYLANNRIAELPSGLFDGLSALTLLDLVSNELARVPDGAFGEIRSIEELDLQENQLTELSEATFAGLSKLKILRLSRNPFVTLPSGLFSGLSSLETLDLFKIEPIELPGSLFSGLHSLKFLDLGQGRVATLPPGIFAGLSNLEDLSFWDGHLTELSQGVFSDLPNLRELNLFSNQLLELPPRIFAGLSRLERLLLGRNNLTSLPNDLIDGLTALKELDLFDNELRSLPDGLFAGQKAIEMLNLASNATNPIPVSVSLEKAGERQFRAVMPTGAPFNLVLGVSASSSGVIMDEAGTTMISTGETQSAPVRVDRMKDKQDGVSVDITAMPLLPSNHAGYAFVKDDSLPRWILPSLLGDDVALVGLTLDHGMLEPVFSAETTRYRALVPNDVSLLSVTPTTRNTSATVTYLDEDDAELVDANTSIDGQQLMLDIGENMIVVQVSSEDGTREGRYTILVTRDGAAQVCLRTQQVQNAILSATGADDCTILGESELARVTEIDLHRADISSLRPGDFSGLFALESLDLYGNQISSLPAGVFAELANLKELNLGANDIGKLPRGVFSRLTVINSLALDYNRLSTLHSDDFSGLTAMTTLDLGGNNLVSLPVGVFSDLARIEKLYLYANRLTNLPAELFSDLRSLRFLRLQLNRLRDLPNGVFSDLSALENLALYSNEFRKLPDGIFAGMNMLQSLDVRRNVFDPLPLVISLEKVGESQFKAVAPTGAPFDVEVSVSVSGSGTLELEASTVTIPAGAIESKPLGVTRAEDAREAVSVAISGLPALPQNHAGYFLQKDASGPRVILPGPEDPSPAQVTGVQVSPGPANLDVSWATESDANGYKVQWKSGDEAYGEERQAVLTGGETVTYTITGLTAGTEYTVRVLSTKEYADDGPPSSEVTGTPKAEPSMQVTGVEVTVGVEQLDVSWTVVADASGYKVQWKSGNEDYDESRQAVVTGGDTVSQTIAGLTAGTEYTIRVIAVMDDAEDGLPSSEMSGTPTVLPPAQVTDVELSAGVEQLDVSWSAVSDASGYKVQWKSGEEAYEESRQSVLAGGETVNYTIAGLTAGRSYTIRIIATKVHADDGAPSNEVTGIPKAGPPAQVEGVELTSGVEQLDVSWTAVSDAGGYKVQWKSGTEDYDESRQAVLTDGDTVSHTITGLTAGTAYAVRVIATKAYAEDGLPSAEVSGIPKAQPPAQVTGVEVEPGFEQLDVSWTAVSDANGYKVQWKSGTEAYGDARQAVIASGDTSSHTIIDLTADTEYTIRVMATKDHADDGLPSDEVTATPISADPDVNGDGVLDGNDALILYHSYASAAQLGDGETGGTPESRQSLLAGYSGQTNPSDDDLKAMIRKANAWKAAGVDAGGDINEDGVIDESDAFVMYYAYATENLVGDGETGGTARFRQLLLAAFANKDNPTDEDLKKMLRRANKLREDFG